MAQPPQPVPSRDPGPHRPPRRRDATHRWRLLLWRLRFAVAAALLGTTTALVVAELRPAPAPTVGVAVAARALAPGGALTADDVRVVRMPSALAPSGSNSRIGEVVGRSLVIGAPPGLPIVDGLLAGDRLASAGPKGTVVAPIRLADPSVAALLRAGDRIDVLASAATADGEPAARLLARRAHVLVGPAAREPGASEPGGEGSPGAAAGLWGSTADLAAGAAASELTLVAVTPAEAAALAGTVGWANLSAVVVE